ncbi:MAG: peptide-methionine (S)-S-oxide reductase [Alphaproteobacteria bacterium]|jgi:peptide-methionine (S)-S-oxide reductase
MIKLFTAIIVLGTLMTNQTQATENLSKATFAGGCFWCMEKPYDQLNGVKNVVSGYTGGHIKNPTYKQVSGGSSGHVEAIQITYDASLVSFEKLLEVFWVNIDPTVENRQFCDVGEQYRSEVFYHDDVQKKAAEESVRNLVKKGFTIKTKIVKAETFYAAEDYHQDYYIKNPIRYKYYRYSCGRDNRLDDLWGKNRLYPKD